MKKISTGMYPTTPTARGITNKQQNQQQKQTLQIPTSQKQATTWILVEFGVWLLAQKNQARSGGRSGTKNTIPSITKAIKQPHRHRNRLSKKATTCHFQRTGTANKRGLYSNPNFSIQTLICRSHTQCTTLLFRGISSGT